MTKKNWQILENWQNIFNFYTFLCNYRVNQLESLPMNNLKTITLVWFLSLSQVIIAQKQPVSSKFNVTLEKILLDFPSAFSNLKGEIILKDETEVRYESRLVLSGAENCLVNISFAETKKTVSWEAIFLTTALYEEAIKAYKNLYLQLIACRFTLKSKSAVSLIGKWISPKPDENYTTTLLRLSSVTGNYRNMAIELEMVKVIEEWKVNLRVKEND
jgi:hypothetical protein